MIALLLAPLGLSAQSIGVGDPPDWLVELDIPSPKSEHLDYVSNGIYYLVSDRQIRFVDGGTEGYDRITMKVLERAGLEEAASVIRNFDPHIQTLELVGLNLIRDTGTYDLRDTTEFQIFRRETDLERGIIDGSLTGHANIPGVKVGDNIDVAFRWNTDHRFDQAKHWTSPIHTFAQFSRQVPWQQMPSYEGNKQ